MLRLFAKWWAKRSYLWQLEVEAGKSDINAATAAQNGAAANRLAQQLA